MRLWLLNSVQKGKLESQLYKEKRFDYTRFSSDVLREALEVFLDCFDLSSEALEHDLRVTIYEEEWGYDSIDEFLSDYRQSTGYCAFVIRSKAGYLRLMVTLFHGTDTKIVVHGQTRQKFQSVFEVFERNAESSRLERPPKPPPPSPNIFIGHGRSNVWRDLKDHLQDDHGYNIVSHEIGARAGYAIRDILEDMLSESAIALLVMTGEDEMKDNKLLPRLSVVHELGLLQGHLGFGRATVLLEEDTRESANIHCIQQIRFANCNIRESFVEVLATLRREFPGHSNQLTSLKGLLFFLRYRMHAKNCLTSLGSCDPTKCPSSNS